MLVQSIILTTIFSGYGFGLVGRTLTGSRPPQIAIAVTAGLIIALSIWRTPLRDGAPRMDTAAYNLFRQPRLRLCVWTCRSKRAVAGHSVGWLLVDTRVGALCP